MSPDEVVNRQVDAYNRHDLDAFIACYADVAVVRAPDGTVTLAGSAAIAEQYGAWFRTLPNLHVEVQGRLAAGSWVVDDERVILGGGSEMRGLAVYEVRDDLIHSVLLLTEAERSARPGRANL